MKYHIKLEDESTIASFKNEYDRDHFISALREKYPDIDDDYFSAVNEEEK